VIRTSEDPTIFNIITDDGDILCPCCGLAGQFNEGPYDAGGGIIGSGICSTCFWEPGFDDDPGASGEALPTIRASLFAYRIRWITEGCVWRSAKSAPPGWDGAAQLANLLHRFPFLA
jgi:hypothetical protein